MSVDGWVEQQSAHRKDTEVWTVPYCRPDASGEAGGYTIPRWEQGGTLVRGESWNRLARLPGWCGTGGSKALRVWLVR
jgi:hypothetical protein